MASQFLPLAVVDDSGTPAAPVGNGTQINAALFAQLDANLNEFWTRATKTVGGVWTWESFGAHAMAAGGTGAHGLTVRNTSAGTTNLGQVAVGANGAGLLTLQMASTALTPSGSLNASGGRLVCTGTGGLALDASAGAVRFFAPTERMRIDPTAGQVLVGTTSVLDVQARFQVSGSTDVSAWTLGLHHASSGSGIVGLNFRIDSTDLWQLRAHSPDANALRFDYTGVPKLRFAASTGHVTPGGDATQDFGSASLRWASVFVAALVTGDIKFDNAFVLTEHDKIGIETPGMALMNDKGALVCFFDASGRVYARDYRRLEDLR